MAEEKPARITLGEVSAVASSTSRDAADIATLMRGAAQRELVGLAGDAAMGGGASAKTRKGVIVSLALVRIETTPNASGASVEAAVSATLRTARDGALFAILEGRARAEGSGPRDALESDAIRAAVKGTMARIPSALR